MSLFASAIERRSLEKRSIGGPGWPMVQGEIPLNSSLPLGRSNAGITVTEQRALQQMTVWACVSLISDTVSTLPLGAFRKVSGSPKEEITPTPKLLVEPSPGIDIQSWLMMGMVSLLLRGNFYGLIVERDSNLFPTNIVPVHPDWVIPPRRLLAGMDPAYKYYSVFGEKYDPIDVMHIKGLTQPGYPYGLSPVAFAAQAIGLALGAEEFGANFFGDGATPASVIESDQEMEEPAAKAMMARWQKAHGDRHRNPALLTGGAKWKPIQIAPEEAQFLQTRSYQRDEILGLYRVPPHMVGEHTKNSTWGAGMEEIGRQWVQYGLLHWLIRFENKLTSYLPKPRYVKFNVDALQRARYLDRMQGYLIGRQAGIYSPDDCRALEDLGPIPDGSGADYAQPLNWGPLGTEPTPKPETQGAIPQ